MCKPIKESLLELDDWLSNEIDCYERTISRAKIIGRVDCAMHSAGVRDGFQMVRSWLHISVLDERIIPGDVLTVWMIKKIRNAPIPEKLISDVMGPDSVHE